NGSPNAGTWTITPGPGTMTAPNYVFLMFNPGTLTVDKSPLTVTANSAATTYGIPVTFTAAFTGLVNNDGSDVIHGTPSFSTNATLTNGSPDAGTWTITPSLGTLSASNYTFPTF